MRIAVVSPWAFDNARGWSGMVPRMWPALNEVSDAVPVPVPVHDLRFSIVDRVATRALHGRRGKKYLHTQALASSRAWARPVTERIRKSGADVVVGIAASQQLAFADPAIPVVHVGDTTFGLIADYYPMFTHLHSVSRSQGQALARQTARSGQGFVMASEWARASWVSDYGVPIEHTAVAPFGPSLATAAAPGHPKNDRLRLLLVASDWERKGGGPRRAGVAAGRRRGPSRRSDGGRSRAETAARRAGSRPRPSGRNAPHLPRARPAARARQSQLRGGDHD